MYPLCGYCGLGLDGNYEEIDNDTAYHSYCAVMRRRLAEINDGPSEEKEKVTALLKDVNPDNIWLEDFEKHFLYWLGGKREHPINVEWDGVAL